MKDASPVFIAQSLANYKKSSFSYVFRNYEEYLSIWNKINQDETTMREIVNSRFNSKYGENRIYASLPAVWSFKLKALITVSSIISIIAFALLVLSADAIINKKVDVAIPLFNCVIKGIYPVYLSIISGFVTFGAGFIAKESSGIRFLSKKLDVNSPSNVGSQVGLRVNNNLIVHP